MATLAFLQIPSVLYHTFYARVPPLEDSVRHCTPHVMLEYILLRMGMEDSQAVAPNRVWWHARFRYSSTIC
jgi:hypothetical protein